MLNLINQLCKTKDFLNTSSLENILANQTHVTKTSFNDLVNYSHPQTADNILHYSARCGNLTLLCEITKKIGLANAKIFFSKSNKDGKNALHEAAQNSHFNCVKYLVEVIEISVNTLRKGDWTPLMLACTKNNLDIVKFLLENKADVNQLNKDGWNALHIAVREGHYEIVNYLLGFNNVKQSLDQRSKNGRTVYHTSALHGHLDILVLLLFASKKNSEDMQLNDLNILSMKDSCGITPFMDAVLADNDHIVRHICENYNNSNAILGIRDLINNSCIHLAAQSGSMKSLRYLFDKYYNDHSRSLGEMFKNDLNNYGMTPLHSACKNNRSDIVAIILKYIDEKNYGPDFLKELITQSDINGNSPLSICSTSHLKIHENCFAELNKFYLKNE